ncbi:hypothetical protein CsSME_00030332 [Camellia sinensis var. sinensis]
MAKYGRLEDRAAKRNQPGGGIGGNEIRERYAPDHHGLQRSFADVLKIDVNMPAGKAVSTIKVNEEGHIWLYDSVLMKCQTEYSMQSIKEVLKEKGLRHVLVRNGGGRDVVLTFLSKANMLSKLSSIKTWFKDWCEYVKVWEPRFCAEPERYIWLRCCGVPLSMWNRSTCNKIGNIWGSALSLDGDISQPQCFSYGRVRIATGCMEFINTTINLEYKGRLHPVMVCEKQPHSSVVYGSILSSEVKEVHSSNEVDKPEPIGVVVTRLWRIRM